MITKNEAINRRIEVEVLDKKNIPEFVKVALPTEIKFCGTYDPESPPVFHPVVYMIYRLSAYAENTVFYEFQYVVVK